MAKKRKSPEIELPNSPETDVPAVFENLPDEQVRQIALDYVEGKIVANFDVPTDLTSMVFLTLAFGAYSKYPKEFLEQIGMIYEYLSEAPTGRAINGYPMFFSHRAINKHDYEVFCRYVRYLQEQRKNFVKS